MSAKSAFWDRPVKIGDITMRPPSAGMLELVTVLDLKSFTGNDADLTPEERAREMFAFAWAHSTPIEEVWDAIDNGTARKEARRFQWSVPLEDIGKLSAAVAASLELMQKSQVDVVPRPSSSEDDAPPNC